jgi:pyruvate,water dikinase
VTKKDEDVNMTERTATNLSGKAPDARQKLEQKYRFFKNLLSRNNIVLEHMTSLERMIHEGGSFTQEETVTLVEAMVEQCRHLAQDVNALCDGQFPELFERIDAAAGNALNALTRQRTFDFSTLILPLEEITLEHLEEVGGKAANLGEIRNKIGLPTPAGFAVTASAAALFLEQTDLLDTLRHQLAAMDLSDIAALEKVCAKASERIMTAPLPPALEQGLMDKTREIINRFGPKVRLAVRSSAVCEDSDASFAGQHASVLGAAPATLSRAWSAVVASAFTTRAVFYRRTKGYSEQDVMMSVLVLTMIQSKASGVLYTIDPNSAYSDDLLLAAAWGLGVSVVDGSMNVDFWRVRREDKKILVTEIADKKTEFVVLAQGGIVSRPVQEELREQPCLTSAQVDILAEYALRLEAHYGMPMDIEWALDEKDQLIILQARPLQRADGLNQAECCKLVPGRAPLLFAGQTASPGAASGPVYIVQPDHELSAVPQGAILVARQTSPAYVAAMGKVAGIITDVGSPNGHMASVAREFGIPTLVGTGRGTALLTHGMEITLDATNQVVYAGQVVEILSKRKPVNLMQGSPVYKSLQEAMKFINPLHLVDPQLPEFSAQGCRSLHDIIRFAHEMAMQEMFRLSDDLSPHAGAARELRAVLPFRVLLVDLGGGIASNADSSRIELADLRCAPLIALLQGMGHPRIPEVTGRTPKNQAAPTCYAVVSDTYVNLSGRLGNHFATIDSYSGPVINDNYITFSFKGGAAQYEQRVRRTLVLAGILRRQGFRVTQSADSLKAEIRKYDQRRFLERLDMLGRLLAAVRALDWRLDDDSEIARYVDAFMNGDYAFSHP